MREVSKFTMFWCDCQLQSCQMERADKVGYVFHSMLFILWDAFITVLMFGVLVLVTNGNGQKRGEKHCHMSKP
jgi:hypothetical protein